MPVIVLSNLGQESDRQRATQGGARRLSGQGEPVPRTSSSRAWTRPRRDRRRGRDDGAPVTEEELKKLLVQSGSSCSTGPASTRRRRRPAGSSIPLEHTLVERAGSRGPSCSKQLAGVERRLRRAQDQRREAGGAAAPFREEYARRPRPGALPRRGPARSRGHVRPARLADRNLQMAADDGARSPRTWRRRAAIRRAHLLYKGDVREMLERPRSARAPRSPARRGRAGGRGGQGTGRSMPRGGRPRRWSRRPSSWSIGSSSTRSWRGPPTSTSSLTSWRRSCATASTACCRKC